MTPSALGNGDAEARPGTGRTQIIHSGAARTAGPTGQNSRRPRHSTWRCASAGSTVCAGPATTCRSCSGTRAACPGAHGRRPTWPRPRRWQAAYESQRAAAVPPDLAAALATDARAKAAFERLGKSGRYAVILPLLKARTAQTRARILALGSRPTGRSELTHMTGARAASPRAARRCSPDRGYGAKTGVGRIALLH